MGTTSDRGYPYPDATAKVTDGWAAIRDLAEAVDDDVKDTRTMPFARAASGANWGTLNGGVTATLDNMADVEEAGGLTHAAGVFTVPESGVYLITLGVMQTPATAPHNGGRFWFGVNGVAQRLPAFYIGDANLATNMEIGLTEIVRLAANDTIRVGMQGIGGQTTIGKATVSVVKLRD